MFKKIIILITIIGIFFLLFFAYFYITKKEVSTTIKETVGENFIYKIFDFNNTNTKPNLIDNLVDFITNKDEVGEAELQKDKFYKISSMPVSGYGVLEKERYVFIPDVVKDDPIIESPDTPTAPNTEIVPILKYTDKITGNIYQTFVDKIEERKFSETIIPYVYESYFTQGGIIMRYLRNNSIISTFLGELPKEVLGIDSSGGNEVFGSFLPEDIKDISISPDLSKIFYLGNTEKGVVGVITDEVQKNKEVIFDSSFSEWTSFWPNNEKITLTTKPSGLVPGYLYLLDTKTKSFEKIISGISGLTTLMSSNEENILYSNQRLFVSVFNTKNKETKPLNIRTHADKCIWSKDNITIYCAVPKYVDEAFVYPDSWYQGEISYQDEVFKIDTETNEQIKLVDPSEINNGILLDAINLKLDKNEENLFLMNKSDSYVWGIRLN